MSLLGSTDEVCEDSCLIGGSVDEKSTPSVDPETRPVVVTG